MIDWGVIFGIAAAVVVVLLVGLCAIEYGRRVDSERAKRW